MSHEEPRNEADKFYSYEKGKGILFRHRASQISERLAVSPVEGHLPRV
jgi:hypothetical protein